MSQAASQAWAFYRDVAKSRVVWTVRDDGGFPAPLMSDGSRAQPFWSSLSRVQRIIKTVAAYASFAPYEITWDEFCQTWLPELKKDGFKVGVNWSGKNAVGYDLEPDHVQRNVQAVIENPQ